MEAALMYSLVEKKNCTLVKKYLQKQKDVDNITRLTCRTSDRGCKCRKTAGEESPGFIGQDAG